MNRLILKKLLKWKGSPYRKPLILRGARQVGKTYLITEFGQKEFPDFIAIDFEKNKNAKKIFEGNLEVSRLISELEIEAKKKIVPKKTLLFFDEIQLCPRALMALRYFYEDLPELYVIAAGSLLEFEMEKISFPVGRVEFEWMYPLSFSEFLEATGQQMLLEKRPSFDSLEAVDAFIHQKFLEQIKIYFLVGGMPEAVLRYVQTGSFYEVVQVHKNLLTALSQDILKYERTIQLDYLQEVFEGLAKIVGKQTKYTSLIPEGKIYETKKTLRVLEKALLIHKVISASAKSLPLSSTHQKIFKYIFVDVGLLQHMSGVSAGEVLNAGDLFNTYLGTLCEQFVGQELLVYGASWHQQLYYWSRAEKSSQAELDYLMDIDGKIIPLEIKKGPQGRLKSLHLFLKEHPHIKKGYVLNESRGGVEGNIIFKPLYTRLPSPILPFKSSL